MEQYYYNRMNKIEQAVYHALYQGFLNIDEEIQIPRLEGEALYNVFFKLRLDHPEIFWATGYKYKYYNDSPNLIFVPEYLFEKAKIKENQKPENKTPRNTSGKNKAGKAEQMDFRYDYFNLDDKNIFRDHEPLLYPAPACNEGGRYYYKEKELSFTKIEDVYKRSLQAAKKGRVLTFHWRGGYLTKEVLKELLEEIERAGREKNKQPQISLNWAQAVLRVEYQELPEGMIRETKVVMEDANEGEREIIGNREKKKIEKVAVKKRDPESKEEEEREKKKKPPIDVDFEKLKSINDDVIGWIYVDALPDISYPIVQGKDNQTYLHQTYEKNYNFAGTIFVDYENGRDFNDCNTLVYGHNMKNGSMFGHLKKFTEDEKLYNNDRYFWILTPDKNYRYEIISAYTTGVNSDTYTLFKGPGEEFEEYLKKIKSYSDIKTEDTELTIKDKIVTLSTCTGNESTRFVVQGKRVNAEDDGSGENAGSANSDAASVDSVTVQEG